MGMDVNAENLFNRKRYFTPSEYTNQVYPGRTDQCLQHDSFQIPLIAMLRSLNKHIDELWLRQFHELLGQ